jgi:hypothetical protein
MSDKLNINNEMRQFDLKNRTFYDELTDEERKKFSNFLMLRWGSSVGGAPELTSYYLLSMNQNANKHFWSLNKHPKLQWLLMTCVSPGMGTHKHEWIAFKGKAAKNKKAQAIAKLYPAMKIDEAELLSQTITDKELRELMSDWGWTEEQIKKALDK